MHNRNIVINIEESLENIRGLVMVTNPRLQSEDLSSFVKGVGVFFTSKINKVAMTMGFFGSNKKNGPTEFNDINTFVKVMSDSRKNIDRAANANYRTYESLRIPTVPGLTTNMPDAVDKTIKMIAKINSVLEPKLDDLDTLVSKVLSDEAFRTSTRPIIHDKTISKVIDELQKEINTFISPKQMQDTVLLKDIYPNMRSIKDCFEKLINTTSHGALEQLQFYKKKIDKIVEKINFLVDELKRHPDMVISKAVLKELSLETEEVAELVTIGMNVFFLFNQLTQVIRTTAEGIHG